MPVILENSSEAVRKWLDPKRTEWTLELRSLLKPFQGELECYQVSKDVGKVGNDSSSFVVPISSSENKNNIANFFANAKEPKRVEKDTSGEKHPASGPTKAEPIPQSVKTDDNRATVNAPRSEDNAPMPVAPDQKLGEKRGHDKSTPDSPPKKLQKVAKSSPTKSPVKNVSDKKLRSATSNNTGPAKSKGQNQKITNFFAK